MNTLPLTPSNPHFNNHVEVIEDTIIRYTKNGRWFEIHRNNAMLSMFGYEKGTSFYDLPRHILHSIIHNKHEHEGFDVTTEVEEEIQEGCAFHLVLLPTA